MARVTKEADVRRDELLDVALELCVRDGFAGTSVERITEAAGVAKGTFYHYFSSKQDLLAQLVDRFGDALFTHLETQMASVGGGAIERMQALMALSAAWKAAEMDSAAAYVPFLFMEENYTLRHKLWTVWMERTRPLVLDIVERGAREGTFSVDDPDSVTGIVLCLWYDAANRILERAMAQPDDDGYADTLARGLTALWTAQERVLGAPEGSFQVKVDPAALAATRAILPIIAGSAGDRRRGPGGRRGDHVG